MRIQLRYKLSAMEVPRTSKVPAQSWHRANTWQVTASVTGRVTMIHFMVPCY